MRRSRPWIPAFAGMKKELEAAICPFPEREGSGVGRRPRNAGEYHLEHPMIFFEHRHFRR